MVCYGLGTWSLILVVVYFVVRKITSRLRIDRYTDVYVLITGCDTGFGNEAAKRFDRMGCHVFAGCFTEKGKESLKEECSDRLHAISLDVRNIESIREAYDYVKANLPKGRGLWGVINNAGIAGKLGPLEWLSLDDYREVFDVNLYGVINVTMTFLPLVKKARGRIVNTASMAGRVSAPLTTPYSISKYGVEAFTDGIRRSLRPFGVKAVLIEPGAHQTAMTTQEAFRTKLTATWDSASSAAKAEYGEGFLKAGQRALNSRPQKTHHTDCQQTDRGIHRRSTELQIVLMVCFVLVTWSLILVVVYFVVRKIISRLRIDRYTDVYVLITGCDTGFGNEAAKRFDRMGCHVFAGCLTEDGRGSLKHGCSDRLHAISLDVTKIESIREAYDYVRNNLPKGRGLWGVINNAGIFGKMGPLEWLRLDDYREVCDVNLYGVIEATMTFLPLVKKARGRIYSQYGPHLWSVLVSCNYTILHLEVWCRSIYRRSEAFTSSFGVKAVLIEPGSHKTHLTSTENYFNLMTAAWNGASAEAKAEYGEEFLQEAINSIIKFTDIVGSDRITDVVDAYEEGLLDRYPRARYLVGKDCYTILLPLQAMPEWLGDWLLDSLGKPPRPLSRNQLPYSKNNK